MFYGDFPSIPFHWFITLQNRKTLFCVFLIFRDLTELKWIGIFLASIFLHEKQLEHQKYRKRPTRPKQA